MERIAVLHTLYPVKVPDVVSDNVWRLSLAKTDPPDVESVEATVIHPLWVLRCRT
jgi:hypothetical protein